MNSSENISTIAAELEREGFYVFHNALDSEQVETARQEINRWLDVDVKEREEAASQEPWHTGAAGTSILTNPTHLLLDAYAKSPALDQLVEKILTDPVAAGVLKELAGENIKFRGYNIQRMTGKLDARPDIGIAPNPHEWHRDSPGEFGIALFLEDVPGPNNGATSLISGSHFYPYCPRWNCLLGPPFLTGNGKRGLRFFLRYSWANRILGQRILKKATGAYGKQGDFYFFINDVWHGREPNTEGRSGIKMMIGAFPADDPFPDRVVPPSAETLAKLPLHVRLAASQEAVAPPGSTDGTILKRLRKWRSEHAPELIFRLAKLERQFAELISRAIVMPASSINIRFEILKARLHRVGVIFDRLVRRALRDLPAFKH
jgi:hypothetical protein